MSKEQIARVLTVAVPERVSCGCRRLHMTVPFSALDGDLDVARGAFPETHFERPNAYEICYCGDYRHQHEDNDGRCLLRGRCTPTPCLRFVLAGGA